MLPCIYIPVSYSNVHSMVSITLVYLMKPCKTLLWYHGYFLRYRSFKYEGLGQDFALCNFCYFYSSAFEPCDFTNNMRYKNSTKFHLSTK